MLNLFKIFIIKDPINDGILINLFSIFLNIPGYEGYSYC